jgi:hypothetical protein
VFDVRESPAKLAEAEKIYPAVAKSGGVATKAGEEPDSKPSMTPQLTTRPQSAKPTGSNAGDSDPTRCASQEVAVRVSHELGA